MDCHEQLGTYTECMKIAIAQIAPVFLNRTETISKTIQFITSAAKEGCALVAFGETLIPAYPVWLARTNGARFNNHDQKEIHALYLEQAVCIEDGELDPVCDAAREHEITVIVGIAERPIDRGGQTVYCSRVIIDSCGQVVSVHRKLMPTYEERLAWGIGDGAGLTVHRVGEFAVGSLNCWENWMPLARSALYAQGENLHVAIWPGCEQLTQDITRFIALESRSFVISASCVIREQDIPSGVPLRDQMVQPGETIYDGGSCIASPDGSWLIEPQKNREQLIVANLDINDVRRERQNFDPSGHYARPDVFSLTVNRTRQRPTDLIE